MSDDSLPASSGHYKSLPLIDMNLTIREVYSDGALRIGGPFPPQPPAKPRRRRPPRKSGLYAVLHAAQQFGLTHPREGFWTMLPKEFQAIDALEPKDVSQVVLEILAQTIGAFEYGQDGRPQQKEWAALSYRHFARAGLIGRTEQTNVKFHRLQESTVKTSNQAFLMRYARNFSAFLSRDMAEDNGRFRRR
jgi:hypothetical protein